MKGKNQEMPIDGLSGDDAYERYVLGRVHDYGEDVAVQDKAQWLADNGYAPTIEQGLNEIYDTITTVEAAPDYPRPVACEDETTRAVEDAKREADGYLDYVLREVQWMKGNGCGSEEILAVMRRYMRRSPAMPRAKGQPKTQYESNEAREYRRRQEIGRIDPLRELVRLSSKLDDILDAALLKEAQAEVAADTAREMFNLADKLSGNFQTFVMEKYQAKLLRFHY